MVNITKKPCISAKKYAIIRQTTLYGGSHLGSRWKRGTAYLAVILLLMSFLLPAQAEETVFSLEYFQYNTCASCHPEEDFYAIVTETIGDLKEDYPYQIYEYNTFHVEDKARLKERLAVVGAAADTEEPLVIVGGTVLSGLEEIEAGLRDAYLSLALGGQPETGPEEQTEAESAAAPSAEEAIVDLQSQLMEALVGDEEGDAVLLYFSTLSCDDCASVKKILSDLGDAVTVHEFSIADGDYVLLLQELFAVYGVPAEEQQVPILFYDGGYLSGAAAVEENLETLLETGMIHTFGTDILNSVTDEKKSAEAATFTDYGSLIVTGLVNGINPCGASMLLMLLAAVAVAGRSVWKAGLSYLIGKFLAYCAMGMGVYKILQAVGQEALSGVSRVLTVAFAVFFLVLALLYLRDFVYARRKEYGKIKMQLPGKLRRWNHKRIETLSGTGGFWLWPASFALGVVISAGEFFCTGQVYLAAILYLMKMQDTRQVGTVLAFLIYVAAMCVPSLLIVAVLEKTRNAIRVSNATLKWMPVIKLVTAAVFFFFAVFMLLS